MDELKDNYKTKFKKIFSTLVPESYLDTFYLDWVVPEIANIEHNTLVKLTTLLQSVNLVKTDNGVLLFFYDNLSLDASDVKLFISMMKTILLDLQGNKNIGFYSIYHNDVEIPGSHGRHNYLSTIGVLDSGDPRASVSRASVSRASVTATNTFNAIWGTQNGINVSNEIRRIVDNIFEKVKDLKNDRGAGINVDRAKKQAIIAITQSISLHDDSNAILTSLFEFLEKVKASDIELTPDGKMVTLTLHDKITLFESVKDEYCKELTKFLELMTKLCKICTNTLKGIYTNFDSVTFNIPQGVMDSLHKSKQKCDQLPPQANLSTAAAASQGGGRTRRRKHARKTNRKHNRKTHHRRASKSHKRARRSRTARKHKKYSRRH